MISAAGWGRAAGDIVAEIEMVLTNWCGQVLILEGPSDECFFSRRVSHSVYIVQADGRNNVEGAIAILDGDVNHVSTQFLGLIDEDYDWLLGAQTTSQNIIKLDPRDLEGMLLRSNALSAVLAELADREQVNNFTVSSGCSIRDAITARGEFFGRVRMFNAMNNQVCLNKFKPQRFCDIRNWSYDTNAALVEAVRLGVHSDPAVLGQDISAISAPSIWHCVRGHDLIDILVGGLLGVLGGRNVGRNDVERLLRQAMSDAEFSGSAFYGRLSAWQQNRGYRIF